MVLNCKSLHLERNPRTQQQGSLMNNVQQVHVLASKWWRAMDWDLGDKRSCQACTTNWL